MLGRYLPSFAALVFAAAASVAAAPAPETGTFVLTITDARGVPVRDAVVSVKPAGVAALPAPSVGSFRMVQRNIAFNPGTLMVPVGATVAFPNEDKVRHHVYSFSKPARFEIELYGREQSRTQRFAVAGTVALGCNIHDRMQGYIRVVDTPFAAKTDEYGRVRIAGLPGGGVRVVVWHPQQRAPGGESAHAVQIQAGVTANKDLQMALKTP